MNIKIYIFSVNDLNTTAHYFKKASQQMGYKVIYLTKNFKTKILKPNDIFLYIDPVKDFPFFLEKVTCRTAAYFIVESWIIYIIENYIDFSEWAARAAPAICLSIRYSTSCNWITIEKSSILPIFIYKVRRIISKSS